MRNSKRSKRCLVCDILVFSSQPKSHQVFEALKSGTVALKGTQEEFGIDAVDDVMDELNEVSLLKFDSSMHRLQT